MPKEKQNNDNVHNRRQYTLMSSDDIASGKKSSWYSLEISGLVKNLSPELWGLQFLSSLFLSDNHLTHLPSEICKLYHLTILDLSNNKLRSLPAEIGDLIQLRELLLNYNCLRVLPYEIGKLFQLHSLGLQGNPLNPELNNLYNECNGTNRLLSFMLDSLPKPLMFNEILKVGGNHEDIIDQNKKHLYNCVENYVQNYSSNDRQ